jgi:hypothetical protein
MKKLKNLGDSLSKKETRKITGGYSGGWSGTLGKSCWIALPGQTIGAGGCTDGSCCRGSYNSNGNGIIGLCVVC